MSVRAKSASEQRTQLAAVLGAELLKALLGRETTVEQGATAERLQALSGLVEALAGAYNAAGVRGWFARPRPQLGGLSPLQALPPGWGPDSPEFRTVRELAARLLSA